MRKLLLFLYIIFLASCIILAYYGDLKTFRVEEFYSIRENAGYVYDEDRELKFNIYSTSSNSLIAYPDKNQYSLELEYAEFNLNNVKVDKAQMDKMTIYTIIASLDSCFAHQSSKSAILKIKNSKYTLEINMGEFSCISSMDYPLLSFDALSPAYSYYNQMLYFCGINIDFDSIYHKINKIEIGKNAYGILDLCDDTPHEGTILIKNIIPSYSLNYKSATNYILNNSFVFVPFAYKEIELIRRHYILVTVDDITYYIDSVLYYPSDYIFNMYDSFKEKGVVTYA